MKTIRIGIIGLIAILLVAGIGGLAWVLGQGFAIGLHGWQFNFLGDLLGPLERRQVGMGYFLVVYIPVIF